MLFSLVSYHIILFQFYSQNSNHSSFHFHSQNSTAPSVNTLSGSNGNLDFEPLKNYAMKVVISHDLLSCSFTGESVKHMALEVKPARLASQRTGLDKPISLRAEGAHPRVFIHINRADGCDAEPGQ